MALNNKHTFALFYPQLGTILRQPQVRCRDATICHRLADVLRVQVGEQVILFDGKQHVTLVVENCTRKEVAFSLVSIQESKPFLPKIVLLVGLLKKSNFETVLYTATELGINRIVPLITEKGSTDWKRYWKEDRLQAIMIAAAEQAKNYVLPTLEQPQMLAASITQLEHGARVFLAADGDPAWQVIERARGNNVSRHYLCIGPEADFTTKEKQLLSDAAFIPCQLTPTVLRSVQATAVSCGMWRSLFSSE